MKILIAVHRLFTARELIAATALALDQEASGNSVQLLIEKSRYPKVLREFIPLKGIKIFSSEQSARQVKLSLGLISESEIESLAWQQNTNRLDFVTSGNIVDADTPIQATNIIHFDKIFLVGFTRIQSASNYQELEMSVSLESALVTELTNHKQLKAILQTKNEATEQLLSLGSAYPYDNSAQTRKFGYSTRNLLELLDFWGGEYKEVIDIGELQTIIAFLPQFNPFNPRFGTKLILEEERSKLFLAKSMHANEYIAACAPGLDISSLLRKQINTSGLELSIRDMQHFQIAILK